MSGLASGDVPVLLRGVRVHWCAVREGWYLLAPERAVKMDPVAAAVLRETDGERTMEAIVDRLAAAFDAPRERIAMDVGKLYGDLAAKRMLEVRR